MSIVLKDKDGVNVTVAKQISLSFVTFSFDGTVISLSNGIMNAFSIEEPAYFAMSIEKDSTTAVDTDAISIKLSNVNYPLVNEDGTPITYVDIDATHAYELNYSPTDSLFKLVRYDGIFKKKGDFFLEGMVLKASAKKNDRLNSIKIPYVWSVSPTSYLDAFLLLTIKTNIREDSYKIKVISNGSLFTLFYRDVKGVRPLFLVDETEINDVTNRYLYISNILGEDEYIVSSSIETINYHSTGVTKLKFLKDLSSSSIGNTVSIGDEGIFDKDGFTIKTKRLTGEPVKLGRGLNDAEANDIWGGSISSTLPQIKTLIDTNISNANTLVNIIGDGSGYYSSNGDSLREHKPTTVQNDNNPINLGFLSNYLKLTDLGNNSNSIGSVVIDGLNTTDTYKISDTTPRDKDFFSIKDNEELNFIPYVNLQHTSLTSSGTNLNGERSGTQVLFGVTTGNVRIREYKLEDDLTKTFSDDFFCNSIHNYKETAMDNKYVKNIEEGDPLTKTNVISPTFNLSPLSSSAQLLVKIDDVDYEIGATPNRKNNFIKNKYDDLYAPIEISGKKYSSTVLNSRSMSGGKVTDDFISKIDSSLRTLLGTDGFSVIHQDTRGVIFIKYSDGRNYAVGIETNNDLGSTQSGSIIETPLEVFVGFDLTKVVKVHDDNGFMFELQDGSLIIAGDNPYSVATQPFSITLSHDRIWGGSRGFAYLVNGVLNIKNHSINVPLTYSPTGFIKSVHSNMSSIIVCDDTGYKLAGEDVSYNSLNSFSLMDIKDSANTPYLMSNISSLHTFGNGSGLLLRYNGEEMCYKTNLDTGDTLSNQNSILKPTSKALFEYHNDLMLSSYIGVVKEPSNGYSRYISAGQYGYTGNAIKPASSRLGLSMDYYGNSGMNTRITVSDTNNASSLYALVS